MAASDAAADGTEPTPAEPAEPAVQVAPAATDEPGTPNEGETSPAGAGTNDGENRA